MTSVIHFKFRSALLSETLNFDGDYLSLLDLKRLIAKKKGLLNAADIDFSITNKQTGEEYTKEDQFIPKNTEVLVKKVNAKPQLEALRTNPSGTAPTRPAAVALGVALASEPPSSLPFSSTAVSNTDGAAEDLDEDALLKKMIEEQNVEWQRTQQQRRATNFPPNNQKFAPGSGAKPPSHYICNRCEKPGHWKKDCPTMGDPAFDERKFAVGVPICRTRVLADQSGAGAGLDVMRLPDGRLVQCVPAEADFEKAIGTGKQMVNVPADGSIPKELQCAITKDVAENAHILPCCQSNVSLSAVTPILEDRATCPICLQPDITLDMLKPNLRLRETVRTFLKAALDRGIRLKRPLRPETDGDKVQSEKNAESQDVASQPLPPPPLETSATQDIRYADDGRMEAGRQRNGEGPDSPYMLSAGGNAGGSAPFQQYGREGQGRSKRSGAKRRRRKGQLAQSGQGGMGGGGGSGGSFPGQAGTGQFYGGAMPYNSQGMMMNRNGQNSQFPAGYGGMRNMAPQMQMYMNPMGMQRMMPNWPGRPMMMPIAPGQGQNWDDGRESSYESSRSSRFSGSRSRSRGRSLSRNRSRSRSRDRDRRRGGGRSRDTRDTRRDDRERRDRSRSRSRDRDREKLRDRTLKRRDSKAGDEENAVTHGPKDVVNADTAQVTAEEDLREGTDRRSRDKGDDRSRKDRDRSRENSRDRGRRDRSRDDRDGDRYRSDQRDRDRNRDDRGRDRSRDDRERRSRGNRNRDNGSAYDEAYRRGSDAKDGSRSKDSSDRTRQDDKGLTPEEENRIRRFGSKDLVLFSKSEASKNMGAEALELRSKHAERRSAENSEKSQQNIYADDAFDADSNGRDKEEGQERSEPISSERKRRDRADLDEGAPEELPGLYMDAVKRKNRDPVQPYRPPIALLSKKAAAGQERSRVSSQVSVLDRLGTAPVQDSDAGSLRRSKSSGSSGSKRMRGGSGGDVTVTVRL